MTVSVPHSGPVSWALDNGARAAVAVALVLMLVGGLGPALGNPAIRDGLVLSAFVGLVVGVALKILHAVLELILPHGCQNLPPTKGTPP